MVIRGAPRTDTLAAMAASGPIGVQSLILSIEILDRCQACVLVANKLLLPVGNWSSSWQAAGSFSPRYYMQRTTIYRLKLRN